MHSNMLYKSPAGNSLNVREHDKTPIATVFAGVDDVDAASFLLRLAAERVCIGVVVAAAAAAVVDAFCSWDVQSLLMLNIR